MRTLALLLLLPACAASQLKLPPRDESDIRAAIAEYARRDTQRGTGEVWRERGPFVYRVRHIDALVPDVATADADGVRIGGMNGGSRPYTFILTRTHDRWTVVRRIAACRDWPTFQPISEGP